MFPLVSLCPVFHPSLVRPLHSLLQAIFFPSLCSQASLTLHSHALPAHLLPSLRTILSLHLYFLFASSPSCFFSVHSLPFHLVPSSLLCFFNPPSSPPPLSSFHIYLAIHSISLLFLPFCKSPLFPFPSMSIFLPRPKPAIPLSLLPPRCPPLRCNLWAPPLTLAACSLTLKAAFKVTPCKARPSQPRVN